MVELDRNFKRTQIILCRFKILLYHKFGGHCNTKLEIKVRTWHHQNCGNTITHLMIAAAALFLSFSFFKIKVRTWTSPFRISEKVTSIWFWMLKLLWAPMQEWRVVVVFLHLFLLISFSKKDCTLMSTVQARKVYHLERQPKFDLVLVRSL
jgi:hypothetical protein